MIDLTGIPVRSAVSFILALEKCVSWTFNQSTQWRRLKSSCDTCLSPRASANSCLHSRFSRSNSFIFSRYVFGLSPLVFPLSCYLPPPLRIPLNSGASMTLLPRLPSAWNPVIWSGCSSSCLLSRLLLPGDWTGVLWQGKGLLWGWTKCELGRFKQICLQRTYVPLENIVQPLHTPSSVKMDSV